MIGNTYDLTPERVDQMARAAQHAMLHYHTLDVVLSANAAELSALCEAARWAFAQGWEGIEIVMDEHARGNAHEERSGLNATSTGSGVGPGSD